MIIKENLIYKYDNIIEDVYCNNIFNYYKKNHTNNINDANYFDGNVVRTSSNGNLSGGELCDIS